MTLRVGDKVIEVGLGGMHGGFERIASGIGDRAGRKSGIAVRVICGREAHIRMMKRPLIRTREEFGIDDAGVGVKSYAFGQTVVVNTGDLGAFFGNRSL